MLWDRERTNTPVGRASKRWRAGHGRLRCRARPEPLRSLRTRAFRQSRQSAGQGRSQAAPHLPREVFGDKSKAPVIVDISPGEVTPEHKLCAHSSQISRRNIFERARRQDVAAAVRGGITSTFGECRVELHLKALQRYARDKARRGNSGIAASLSRMAFWVRVTCSSS